MMKICVIGDSHTAALKRSWSEIASLYPQVSLTFFASRGVTMSNLKVQNESLIPHKEFIRNQMLLTSNGRSEIKDADYDVFLLYGLKCDVCFISRDSFYSEQLLQQLIYDTIKNTASKQLLEKLRKITQKKIWLGHTPLLASSNINDSMGNDAYLLGLESLNVGYYKKMNAELVAQPINTIVKGRYTHERFTIGSRRLSIRDESESEFHEPEDREHMNDEYGKLWLQHFFDIAS